MLYIILDSFLKDSCIYKPWVSKLHPAGAFSLTKIAYLIFFHMGLTEKAKFLSREVVGLIIGTHGLNRQDYLLAASLSK